MQSPTFFWQRFHVHQAPHTACTTWPRRPISWPTSHQPVRVAGGGVTIYSGTIQLSVQEELLVVGEIPGSWHRTRPRAIRSVSLDFRVRHEFSKLVLTEFWVPRKIGVEYEWSIEKLEYYSSIWSILMSTTRVLKKLETQWVFFLIYLSSTREYR